jgi:hypothetical protein
LNAEDKEIATQSFDFNDVHDSLRDRVSLYGLNKLLTDRTSEQKDKVVKLEAMAGVMDQLAAGDWAKERTVGAVVVSVFVEALAKFKKVSVPAAQQALKGYDKATRDKILANPQIVALAEAIKLEREAAAVVSLDDLA